MSLPDAPRFEDERAGAVDRAARHRRAARLLDRNRLARHHRLVHGRRAVDDDAVHRNALARPDAKPIAHVHVLERHVVLGAVGLDPPRRLRRETEQTANRRARAAARAQLQHLPEQHEHDDDRGRLEIDADLAVHPE